MRSAAWFATKKGKRDKCHAPIRNALEKLGYLVADLGGAADGIPDLAVHSRKWSAGDWRWLECKDENGEPTPAQLKLHAEWLAKGVRIHVVRSLSEALEVCR